MLQSLKDLTGFQLAALDGDVGTLREAYFDDHLWVLRHLVVDTGGWLSGRQVLISPHALRGIDLPRRHLDVGLTRQQIEQAPPIESDRPVSRQYEIAAYDFYGYPYYWGGSNLWGMMDLPMGGAIAPFAAPPPRPLGDPPAADEAETAERIAAERAAADPNLRSSAEVIGYDVAASDGHIGHVADFLLDPATWRIELLVLDTHNWLPDRLVLVPRSRVQKVDWGERAVTVDISRQAVKDSPPYVHGQATAHEEALRLQRHFEGMI